MTSEASSESETPGKKSFKTESREERSSELLYGTNDGVAMSLCHDADLAAVRARSRTDVTLDHGAVPLLHHHWTELAALAGRRLIAPRACPLRENPLECLPELSVEDAVDYRVEGRVTVAEPRENLFERKKCDFGTPLYMDTGKILCARIILRQENFHVSFIELCNNNF